MKSRVFSRFKVCLFTVVVVLMLITTYSASTHAFTASLKNNVIVNSETSNFISLNYANNNIYSVKLYSPKKINDFIGKRLFSNNYFDFEVKSDTNKELKYQLILVPISNLDNKYIKVYLTNQKNKPYVKSKKVQTLDKFNEDTDGFILYEGIVDDSNNVNDFRIRVWIDKDTNDIIDLLEYKLIVKMIKE